VKCGNIVRRASRERVRLASSARVEEAKPPRHAASIRGTSFSPPILGARRGYAASPRRASRGGPARRGATASPRHATAGGRRRRRRRPGRSDRLRRRTSTSDAGARVLLSACVGACGQTPARVPTSARPGGRVRSTPDARRGRWRTVSKYETHRGCSDRVRWASLCICRLSSSLTPEQSRLRNGRAP